MHDNVREQSLFYSLRCAKYLEKVIFYLNGSSEMGELQQESKIISSVQKYENNSENIKPSEVITN